MMKDLKGGRLGRNRCKLADEKLWCRRNVRGAELDGELPLGFGEQLHEGRKVDGRCEGVTTRCVRYSPASGERKKDPKGGVVS
jgi:hypothetical protein